MRETIITCDLCGEEYDEDDTPTVNEEFDIDIKNAKGDSITIGITLSLEDDDICKECLSKLIMQMCNEPLRSRLLEGIEEVVVY